MANCRPGARPHAARPRPHQQGRAGLRLQHALPDARILYVSATGATTVPGLAYAQRLGLWGAGQTPFEHRGDFVTAMEAGRRCGDGSGRPATSSRSASTRPARSPMTGSKSISSSTPSPPSKPASTIAYADGFKIIHTHLHAALEATGIVEDGDTLDRNAKSAAMSAFEGAKLALLRAI